MTVSFGSQVKVGLDIGAGTVYVSQVRTRADSITIEKALRIPRAELPADDIKALAAQVAERMRRGGFALKRVMLTLPAKSSIMRYTMIPPAPPWRINLLVGYEVDDISNRMKDTLCYGWRKQAIGGDGPESPLLLVLGKEVEVNELIGALRGAGIGILSIMPTCEGLLAARRLFVEPPPDEGTEALVEIGEKNTHIIVLREGELLYARQAFFGGEHFNHALAEHMEGSPEKIEQLKKQCTGLESDDSKLDFSEALRRPASQIGNLLKGTLTWADGQIKAGRITLDRILFTGGAARLRGLGRSLGRSSGVPVIRPRLAATVSAEAQPVLQEGIDGFLPSMGIASVAITEEILEVLPETEKKRRSFWNEKVFFFGAAGLLVLFLLVQFAASWKQSSGRERYLGNLEKKVKELDRGFKDLKETQRKQKSLKSKIEVLDVRVNANVFFGSVLHFLTNKLPDDIHLISIRQWPVNEQNALPSVEIEGLADNRNLQAMPLIEEFDGALREEPYIGTVTFIEESSDVKGDRNVIRFIMKVQSSTFEDREGDV